MNWISVKDRLPSSIYSVLMYIVGGPVHWDEDYFDVGIYNPKLKTWQANHGDLDIDVEVSHWCELVLPAGTALDEDVSDESTGATHEVKEWAMEESITEFMDKRIAEANARFKKMTKAQRRVVIAGDAIWQVTSGSVNVNTGYYFCNPSSVGYATCSVCGIGALFAGLADHKKLVKVLNNEVKFNDSFVLINKLRIAFDEAALRLIEGAFEGYSGCSWGWFIRHIDQSPHNRFLRIAANIIHNKGTFDTKRDPPEARLNAIVNKYAKTAKKSKTAA